MEWGNPVLGEVQTAQALEPDRSNPVFLTGGGTSGEAPSLLETQFPHLGNGNNSASWIVQLFSMCDPRTAVSASLGNLLEMQNLRIPPGLTASETLGVAHHTFHKPSRLFKFEDLQPVD